VLSGPLLERIPDELDWGGAWMLVVDVAYLEALPMGGDPLTGRIVVVDGVPGVFGVHAEMAANVRAATDGTEAGEIIWSRRLVQALPAGATAWIRAELAGELQETAEADWEHIGLEISRGLDDRDHLEAAFTMVGQTRPVTDVLGGDGLKESRASAAPELLPVRERVVLNTTPVPGGPGLRLYLPAPTPEEPHGGVMVGASLLKHGDADAEFAAWTDRGQRQATEAHRRLVDRAGELKEGEGFRFESTRALAALSGRELRRSALVFLAQGTGAQVTEELALIAGEESLGEFLAEIGRNTEALEDLPANAASFGWFLERSTLTWLCLRSEDEQRELESELFAVLTRNAGGLALYPSLLRETVAACAGEVQLAQALIQQNRIFLGDAHPAARVRAFDWLEAQGAPPEGFDPLGIADERRAALARLEDELEEGARDE